MSEPLLSSAVKAFSENLELVSPREDPVTYNLNVGLLGIAKGIAELETRIQRLEAAVLQIYRNI